MSLRIHVVALAFLLCASNSNAITFGSSGRDGQTGFRGRDGRHGQALVLQATGQSGSFDIQGEDGGNAGVGQPGYDATSCHQAQSTYNEEGAMGGDGGSGGAGGRGGNGGPITMYFTDIQALRSIYVRGTPGTGGYGAWGGRGGNGCRCQVYSWTPSGSTTAYHCQDGDRGRDGSNGGTGGAGSYGAITLINQLDPIKPEQPSFNIDMSKMELSHFLLSKNHWEARTGARQLFHAGSEISNSYNLYTGRTEVDYAFRWEVSRPVSDFKGWTMTLRMEGTEPKLYLPTGLWVVGEKVVEGNQTTYVFKSVVSTGELGNLQFGSLGGIGLDHTVAVKDNSGVSDILDTSVELQYHSMENNQYKLRFKGVVPAEALATTSTGFTIAMGKLGILEDHLKNGTQSYVGLTITRALGGHSAKYTMGTYYRIHLTVKVGDIVAAAKDSNLYTGNTVVGKVKAGDKFKATKIQGDWIALQKLDGTAMPGWISVFNLQASVE